ncbi:MAG: RNA methyltransferase [Parachlamydiales bacterium]|nr:RNA methyltransferase [Parachlamydiales bacterium]
MFKEIKSPNNLYIKQFIKIRKDRNFRNEKKKVLLIGKNTILDLKKHGFSFDSLITTNKKNFEIFKNAQNFYLVDENVMKKVCGVQSPEDIAVIIDMPNLKILKKDLVLVLDQISDPGNLATLLRTANAFSFDLVILTKSSCDPFNEKVLRSAKGAHFFIPTMQMSESELFLFFKENKKINVFVADMEGKDFSKIKIFEKPLALILGSESKGISNTFKNIGQKITIPLNKTQESLNVAIAGAIIMHKMRLS